MNESSSSIHFSQCLQGLYRRGGGKGIVNAWDEDNMGRTGCCVTAEKKEPSTPIALARDGARPTNAGIMDNTEPLALCVSGLERAGAVASDATHGTWAAHGTRR